MARIVNLQLNRTGAWRNLIEVDWDELGDVDRLHVLSSAVKLVSAAYLDRPFSLRLIPKGVDESPLLHWSSATGWTERTPRAGRR